MDLIQYLEEIPEHLIGDIIMEIFPENIYRFDEISFLGNDVILSSLFWEEAIKNQRFNIKFYELLQILRKQDQKIINKYFLDYIIKSTEQPYNYESSIGPLGNYFYLRDIPNGINIPDKYDKWTILIRAANRGHTEIVKFLLDTADQTGLLTDKEPLFEAIRKNHFNIVKIFLERLPFTWDELMRVVYSSRIADPNIINLITDFAINWIFSNPDQIPLKYSYLKFFNGEIDRKFNFETRFGKINYLKLLDNSDTGYTILMIASHMNHFKIVFILLFKYYVKGIGNINMQDSLGNTALHLGCSNENIYELIKLFIKTAKDTHLDPNIKNLKGETALIACSKYESKGLNELMNFSQDIGLDVNATDNNGDTALMVAIKYDNPKGVSDILTSGFSERKGPDFKVIKNNDGETAESLFRKLNNEASLEFERYKELVQINEKYAQSIKNKQARQDQARQDQARQDQARQDQSLGEKKPESSGTICNII